jgi:hypothetical protein
MSHTSQHHIHTEYQVVEVALIADARPNLFAEALVLVCKAVSRLHALVFHLTLDFVLVREQGGRG